VSAGRPSLPPEAPTRLAVEDFLLLAAAVLMPWAFGGVEIWAYRMGALLLVSAAALAMLKRGWSGLGLDRRARWLLPAFLLALWALIQLVPLPPAAIKLLSPKADEIYRQTFPGYPGGAPENILEALEERALAMAPEFEQYPIPRQRERTLEDGLRGRWSGWRTISLLPSVGIERLHWYIALLLGFLLARQRCRDPGIARSYRNALFACFMALAFFGLIYAATSNDKLYWIRGPLELASPFGPYVNPTNFAGVMELAVPWLAGFALLNMRRSRGMPLAALRSPVVASAALLCLVAALASACKSAAIIMWCSLVVLGLIVARSLKGRLAVVGVAILIVVVLIPVMSRTALGGRVQQFVQMTGGSYGEVGRPICWRSAAGMVADYPLTGSGFGSFRDVFPEYMPTGEYARWEKLHSDYYEVLVEGGIIAALLLLWLVWNFWSRALRKAAWRSGGMPNPEGVGLLLGLGALSVHAAFDFNHQIPANALLFTTMAAVAVARAESSPDSGSIGGHRKRSFLVVSLAVAVVALFGVRAASGWVAGLNFTKGKRLAEAGQWERAMPYLEGAAVGANRGWANWLLGQAKGYIWEDRFAAGASLEELEEIHLRAREVLTEGIAISPASGWYWGDLGYVYHQQEREERRRFGYPLGLLGADAEALVGRPGRIALGMTRIALRREPVLFPLHDQLALMYLDYGLWERSLQAVHRSAMVQPIYRFHYYHALDPVPPELLAAFAAGSRQALGQTPFLRRVLHYLALGRIELKRGELRRAEEDLRASLELPGESMNRAEAHYYLGLVLTRQGRLEEARRALEKAEKHPNFKAAAAAGQAVIAEREGRLEEALELLGRSRRLRPRHLGDLLEFARVARLLGKWDQAEAALKWGILTHPAEPGPVRSLVTTYIGMGKLGEAERALGDLVALEGESESVRRLTLAIDRARDF
jgi:tetratricopeptide (TPR) repeat protein